MPENRFSPHPPQHFDFHCFACGEHFTARWSPGDNVVCQHCDQEYTTDYDQGVKPFIVRAVAAPETPEDDDQTWGE